MRKRDVIRGQKERGIGNILSNKNQCSIIGVASKAEVTKPCQAMATSCKAHIVGSKGTYRVGWTCQFVASDKMQQHIL